MLSRNLEISLTQMSSFRDLHLVGEKRKDIITTANVGYIYKDVKDYEHN